jgi:uncharacterized protein
MNLWTITIAVAGLCLPFVDVTRGADSPDLQDLAASAASGDAAAQFQLGRAYYRGEGVAKDEKKALEWVEKSADQGNPDAITSMGFFHAQGIAVPMDEGKAVTWFRKGAEAGSPQSQLNLGLMLRQGKTIERNHEESVKWLDRAASSGDRDAIKTVGQLYFLGDALMMPDREKAYPFVLQAAEAGDPACQNKMGIICREGIGQGALHKDREKAIAWFRKAALQGDVKAQSNLGHILGAESPATENRQEALMWLYLAADQGEATSDKTLKEIATSIPPDLQRHARSDAVRQRLLLSVSRSKKDKLEAGNTDPKEEKIGD